MNSWHPVTLRSLCWSLAVPFVAACATTTGGAADRTAERRSSSGDESRGERDEARAPLPRSISGEEIGRLYRQSDELLRACFSATIAESSRAAVLVQATLTVAASGQVTETRIAPTGAAALPQGLADCLRQVIVRWRLEPLGGDGAELELPLAFDPADR